MKKQINELAILLDEGLKIVLADKKVIKAFTEKKKADGKKLTTDGKKLDGKWMGGNGIAEWKSGKIHFNDLGSKAAQTVEKAVRKEAPKNWLAEELLTEKTYYILVGKQNRKSPYELVFGDYDKETVEDEKDDVEDEWKGLKVVKSSSDAQKKIDALVKGMNEDVELDEALKVMKIKDPIDVKRVKQNYNMLVRYAGDAVDKAVDLTSQAATQATQMSIAAKKYPNDPQLKDWKRTAAFDLAEAADELRKIRDNVNKL